MRRFLLHAFAFVAVQLIVLVVVWRACPDDPNHYMAATVDKHARLRSAEGPRVIFVGGSSVGFGIDSRPFEPLGLHPVNMGLNDGLGLPFMLAEVDGHLRRGDVVIVAPETHLYWSRAQDDAVWAALQRRPASISCVAGAGPRALADLLDQASSFLGRKVRCAAHQLSTDGQLANLYRRGSFDERGDFVAHRDLSPRREKPMDQPWPSTQTLDLNPSLTALESFARRCRDVGAHCFIAWCPSRRGQYETRRPVHAAIEAQLRARVDLPILEVAGDVAYREDDFYDRGPHLTGRAAAERSRELARRLAVRVPELQSTDRP